MKQDKLGEALLKEADLLLLLLGGVGKEEEEKEGEAGGGAAGAGAGRGGEGGGGGGTTEGGAGRAGASLHSEGGGVAYAGAINRYALMSGGKLSAPRRLSAALGPARRVLATPEKKPKKSKKKVGPPVTLLNSSLRDLGCGEEAELCCLLFAAGEEGAARVELLGVKPRCPQDQQGGGGASEGEHGVQARRGGQGGAGAAADGVEP
eukprot:COSAG02_NODE_2474_length_8740_cov_6.957991_1_plen_206_part_00